MGLSDYNRHKLRNNCTYIYMHMQNEWCVSFIIYWNPDSQHLLPIKRMRGALAPTFSAVKEKVDKLMTVPTFLPGPNIPFPRLTLLRLASSLRISLF